MFVSLMMKQMFFDQPSAALGVCGDDSLDVGVF